MSDIADRLRRVVREHLGVDADKVVDDADIMDDLGADEFDLIELVMAFEEELGLEVPPDVAETIYSFGDAVRVFNSDAVKPFFSDPAVETMR